MNVFSYGTLKRGFALQEKGLNTARFQGEVVTAVPYPLFIAVFRADDVGSTWTGPCMSAANCLR